MFGAAAVIGFTTPVLAQTLDRFEYRLPMGMIVLNANSIFQANSPSNEVHTPEMASKFLLTVTAYSSSVDETDSTPFVTASGTKTRQGVIASNLFPFGTQVKIPEFFGNQVFVVEDRMHSRFTGRIDVWMPSKSEALRFGKRETHIEIVEL